MPPTYRERLRAEGLTLAVTGAAGSALLLATQPQATRMPLNTAGQLALFAAALAVVGHKFTARALERATAVGVDQVGSGEPTPLWHVPIPVIGLALAVSVVGRQVLEAAPVSGELERYPGWDAALRATAGGAIFGLYQAFGIERQVARAERRERRTFYRLPGSRFGRGSVLGGVGHA